MQSDPIVDEVRKARDEYAKRFNYDLDAICRDLQEKQRLSHKKAISLPPKRPKKMKFQKNQYRYLDLMTRFVDGKLSGAFFVTEFMELWRRNRDSDYEIKKSWNAPHDEMLIASLRKGEITKEEFARKWNALWGLSETDQSLRDLLDEAFTACDVFNPDPNSREDYEYSEGELRAFVMNILSKLKDICY